MSQELINEEDSSNHTLTALPTTTNKSDLEALICDHHHSFSKSCSNCNYSSTSASSTTPSNSIPALVVHTVNNHLTNTNLLEHHNHQYATSHKELPSKTSLRLDLNLQHSIPEMSQAPLTCPETSSMSSSSSNNNNNNNDINNHSFRSHVTFLASDK